MKTSKLVASVSSLAMAIAIAPSAPSELQAQASVAYVLVESCELAGSGTSADPYLIVTATDLLSIAECADVSTNDIYFEQQSNLYLDPTRNYPSFTILRDETDFTYDGNGFGVYGLNSSVAGNAGLFPEIYNYSDLEIPGNVTIRDLVVQAGSISALDENSSNGYAGVLIGDSSYMNLNVNSVSVVVDDLFGETRAGGLIGNSYRGELSIRSSSANATSLRFDRFGAGGLVGEQSGNGGSSSIVDSHAFASMVGVGGSNEAGGLIGSFRGGDLLIDKSFFIGSVNTSDEWGSAGGGLVGQVITFDDPATLTIRDSVADARVSGGGYVGGLVGNGYNHNNDHDIDITIQNSLVTGTVASSGPYTVGGGLLGYGSDTNLVVDKVVIDLEFEEASADPTSGNYISDSPLTRTISNTYVNSTKVASSDWTLDDLSGAGNWGATLVTGADFGLAASFPGLSFGSSPNGAELAGSWEVCPSGTRPIHSIEASHCSAPSIDYTDTLDLDFGDFTDTGFIGDASHFVRFAISPALPKGLELHPTTGKIFGQALESSASNNYTITAVAAQGSAQDTISLSVGSSAEVVSLEPNLESIATTQTLPVGLITLPENPFTSATVPFAGWSVGGSSGALLQPGAQVLLTEAESLYALWAIGPDCTTNAEVSVGEGYALCQDPDGRYVNPDSAVTSGNFSYFPASTPLTGSELWVTDGTSQGTRLLLDMEPGMTDGVSEVLGVFGDSVYVWGSKNGVEGVYVTDGTLENTIKLADSNFSPSNGMVQLGSSYLFSNEDDTNGSELWITNGTAPGTRLLSDIEVGGDSSFPAYLTVWRDRAYFVAYNSDVGWGEMYVTDGTQEGTELFYESLVGSSDSYIQDLTVVGDKLFFSVDDGSGDGVWVFTDPEDQPEQLASGNVSRIGLTPDGESVVFGLDPLGDYNRNELWVSNGTVEGTQKLKEVAPAGVDGSLRNFFSVGETLYFNSRLPNGNRTAWKTDLTEDGTVRILETVDRPVFTGAVGDVVFGEFRKSGSVRAMLAIGGSLHSTQDSEEQAPSNASSGGGFSLPVVRSAPSFDLSSGLLTISGSGLNQVFGVSIDGQSLLSKYDGSALVIVVPADLATGEKGITLSTPGGSLVIQHSFGAVAQTEPAEIKGWTKKQADGTIKVYAKDIIGAGKVQLMLNGKEIAWVRAVDNTDPKLRFANGAYYLVRTIDLAEGKNAIEIFVDGERVRRVAYTK